MCEPTSREITCWVSILLRILFLKSSQLNPWALTAFSSSSISFRLFPIRIWSSCFTTSVSTLMAKSLPRCSSSDWSIRSRRALFWRSSSATCNCSGVHFPLHSCRASSSALARALSSSELVMISLFTRATISSTILPSADAGFAAVAAGPVTFVPPGAVVAVGVSGFFTGAGFFSSSGSGAAIGGCSSFGGFCAGGVCAGGFCGGGFVAGGFCPNNGHANRSAANSAVFFMNLPISTV